MVPAHVPKQMNEKITPITRRRMPVLTLAKFPLVFPEMKMINPANPMKKNIKKLKKEIAETMSSMGLPFIER